MHSSRRRYASSKIAPVLKASIGSTALPIYRCGAAQCWPFGGNHSYLVTDAKLFEIALQSRSC
jgi:hypothetical protein